ncbi:MAG: PhoH family protein, partial [Lachnospiraceae bacterium]|nr:PhoH family protein [Lachnospiraceae bacterium]
SGLDEACKVLSNVEGISFCNLTSKDVVRHPLVMKIVQEYEKYEKACAKRNSNKRENSGKRSTQKEYRNHQ